MLDERAGGEARITVMRDGEEITARLDLTDVEVWYESGLEEVRGNVVGTVKRGGPAYVAELIGALAEVSVGQVLISGIFFSCPRPGGKDRCSRSVPVSSSTRRGMS